MLRLKWPMMGRFLLYILEDMGFLPMMIRAWMGFSQHEHVAWMRNGDRVVVRLVLASNS